MRATEPSLPRSTPSYSFWAAFMVRSPLKRSRRNACCCKVLVVNGACGLSARSFCSSLATTYFAWSRARAIAVAISSLAASNFLPFHSANSARNEPGGSSGLAVFGSAPSSVFASAVVPFACAGTIENGFGVTETVPVGASKARIFQYSVGTNASISRSRSTTRRRATDCTRPALERRATFLLSRLLSG